MYEIDDINDMMMVVDKGRVVGVLKDVCGGRMEMEEREGIK